MDRADGLPQHQLPSKRYFKTLFSYTPDRPYRISGRMTRVWKVIEVNSVNLANKITSAQPVILKDVWLDKSRNTKAENMDLIFNVIDDFVAQAHESYPGPQGLRRFMTENKLFEHFEQQTKDRLQNLFTERHYQSLFLTKIYAWMGEITKARSGNAKAPLEPIFAGNDRGGTIRSKAKFTRLGASYNSSNLHRSEGAHGLVPVAMAHRDFAQKQQSRFLYAEVCSPLWGLPSLGDVLDILRQALHGK